MIRWFEAKSLFNGHPSIGVTRLKSLDLLKAKKREPDSGMIAPLDIQKVIPDKPRQEDLVKAAPLE